MLEYRVIRKLYINHRVEELVCITLDRKGSREQACKEFDDWVQAERDKAILDYRIKNYLG